MHCDTGSKEVKGHVSRDTPLILAHASAVQAKALSSHTHNPVSQQERSAASCKCAALGSRVHIFQPLIAHNEQFILKNKNETHIILLVQPDIFPLKAAPETLLFGLGSEWTSAWSIGVE